MFKYDRRSLNTFFLSVGKKILSEYTNSESKPPSLTFSMKQLTFSLPKDETI